MAFNMNTLKDIIKYLYLNYPHKNELSKARVVKMIYLADWKSSILYQKQITEIQWYFNHYGPYVSDIIDTIRNDADFTITSQVNIYGEIKELIKLNEIYSSPVISSDAQSVLDFVIKKTSSLSWEDFIQLVYSTYPIVTQPKYSNLNLEKLAVEYIGSLADK